MKKVLIMVGAILLVALVAGGSFYAGMAYQTKQAGEVRNRFMQARGMSEGDLPQFDEFPGGEMPQGMQPPGEARVFFGGGVNGVVKSIDGDVMTISTAQDVTTVNLSADTSIEKNAAATISDLQPGVRVMVTGERDKDGNLTASQIQIVNDDIPGPNNPSPAGTEP